MQAEGSVEHALEDRQPVPEEQLRAFPTEVAVLGGVLAVLLPAGLAAALVRRWRGR